MSQEPTIPSPRWYRTGSGKVLLVMLALAGIYLVTDHWGHVVPWLPWAFLLACPLLHVFMHGGHGGHGGSHGSGPKQGG